MLVFRSLLSAIVLLLMVGCPAPIPPAGTSRTVTAKELVDDHLTNRDAAKLAFHGKTLKVRVPGYVVKDSEVHYFILIDDKQRKPAIIFKFDKPPEKLKGVLWIEGHCEGAKDDEADRGHAGYTFVITVTGCQIVPPPPPTKH